MLPLVILTPNAIKQENVIHFHIGFFPAATDDGEETWRHAEAAATDKPAPRLWSCQAVMVLPLLHGPRLDVAAVAHGRELEARGGFRVPLVAVDRGVEGLEVGPDLVHRF